VTRKWPLTGVVLAVLWLFVRGVTAGPDFTATLSNVGGEFLIGLLVGWPTAYALRRYYADEFAVEGNLRVVPAALAFLGTFLYELLTANVDVAYRVLAPSMPIDPDVVAVPLRVESDVAITTIANSITLTPGTLTMDHDAETNTLYVHAIAAEDLESVLGPIRQWEDSALVVFEGRDPDLEVPRRGYMDTERIAEATTAARADGGDHGGESGGR
jgi:multicomponent Na+:H+ antiporter subunit E